MSPRHFHRIPRGLALGLSSASLAALAAGAPALAQPADNGTSVQPVNHLARPAHMGPGEQAAVRRAQSTGRTIARPSPDARDAARRAESTGRTIGRPSPDAQDAARRAQSTGRTIGRPSPDTLDAAAGRGPLSVSTVQPASAEASSDFDWGDAGIGAGAALALVTLAGGGFAIARRHGSLADPTRS